MSKKTETNPYMEPFFEGAKSGKLMIPFCRDCEKFFYYPRILCPQCTKSDVEYKEVEKSGSIVTFSVLYRAPTERFEKELPYAFGVIKLNCGAQMLLRIEGDLASIAVGTTGSIDFREQHGKVLPVFVPGQSS